MCVSVASRSHSPLSPTIQHLITSKRYDNITLKDKKMKSTTMFEYFSVNGIDYYRLNGKYYADNFTIREVITFNQYKNAMMDYLINR